ncbi:MAG: tRNA preQ1(34) S-adenosylmethionine ribosyltransferase-isomerase QueA [Verrucomicrobia bacterium]|nr:MAG: tRNA preQ1(34) S-adenosylmethionine ribosyltransferase-isomerase QueA [Verrucomicrobiota bacterium]
MSSNLRTIDFDYHLPEDRIASRPLADRAASRMMVIHRETGKIEHRLFRDFPQFLQPQDLIVLNDTKVIPARLMSNDGKTELLVTDRTSELRWRCLVRPGKKMRIGATVQVADAIGTVVEVFDNGDRLIEWDRELDLNEHGHLALPHYMKREDEEVDRDRYQTVYAKHEGAIAAPTAGLHFTPEMLEKLPHCFLTLHVGVGTFRPVKADRPEEHDMHWENYHISADTAQAINQSGRTIAIGTTVTRVLEHLAQSAPAGQRISSGDQEGSTNIFLYPPYQFRAVDALLTNFHLPQSTLLMLVSAMASRELILEAYRQAVEENYRFYSYGDCMLIL